MTGESHNPRLSTKASARSQSRFSIEMAETSVPTPSDRATAWISTIGSRTTSQPGRTPNQIIMATSGTSAMMMLMSEATTGTSGVRRRG